MGDDPLEKQIAHQMGHEPYARLPIVWENCNLVSIDCYSVWVAFVFGCMGKIDPVAAAGLSKTNVNLFKSHRSDLA